MGSIIARALFKAGLEVVGYDPLPAARVRLRRSGGPALGHSPCIGTDAMRLRMPMMIERNYEPASMKIALWQKDMQIISEMARSLRCPTPLLDSCYCIYTAAMALGLGQADTAATAEVLARMAGDRA